MIVHSALSDVRPWPVRKPAALERPWNVPTGRLIQLLSLEARPASIALIGRDERTVAALQHAFPSARTEAVEPHQLERAGGFDTVVCACGFWGGFASDVELVECLTELLPTGGHLALMEVRGSTRALGTLLRGHLVPLHQSEERSWMGLWQHLLYVGRKGPIIR